MDICFPLFFFVRFISGILFLKEAIVGCYSIYKCYCNRSDDLVGYIPVDEMIEAKMA
jgi:hypothetical protein